MIWDRHIISNIYMGRSQKGIYCAFVEHPGLVYILDESYGKMKWVAKHHIWFVPGPLSEHIDGPWTLQDINYYNDPGSYGDENSEAIEEQKFEWDSDNDNVIDAKDRNIFACSWWYYFPWISSLQGGCVLGSHVYPRSGIPFKYQKSPRLGQPLPKILWNRYGYPAIYRRFFSIYTLDGRVSRRQLI